MKHRLRRYDVFRFAQNDVAPVGRNDAMFAPMCRQAHIIRRSRHHWQSQHHLPKANIIQKRLICRETNQAFLLAHPYKIDPQSKFFRNRSMIFSQRIDLSIGDDGSCTRPLSSGVQLHACKRSYVGYLIISSRRYILTSAKRTSLNCAFPNSSKSSQYLPNSIRYKRLPSGG